MTLWAFRVVTTLAARKPTDATRRAAIRAARFSETDIAHDDSMTLINYLTRIHFAEHVFTEALRAEIDERRIQKPLIIGAAAAGRVWTERLSAALPPRCLPEFLDLPARAPPEMRIRRKLGALRALGCDGIVSIGGADAMNFGRLLRLAAADDRPLAAIARHEKRRAESETPPLIAIPAPTACLAALGGYVRVRLGDQETTLLASPLLRPDVVIFDPAAEERVQAWPRAAAAAFAVAAETWLCDGCNPPAEGIALEALRRVCVALPALQSRDVSARRDIAAACLNAALSQQKGPGLSFTLADALCALSRGKPEFGQITGLILPQALGLFDTKPSDRLAAMRAIAGGADSLLSPPQSAAPARILSGMGVSREEIIHAAKDAAGDLSTYRNPVAPHADSLAALLLPFH